jgi:hypothetical protein
MDACLGFRTTGANFRGIFGRAAFQRGRRGSYRVRILGGALCCDACWRRKHRTPFDPAAMHAKSRLVAGPEAAVQHLRRCSSASRTSQSGCSKPNWCVPLSVCLCTRACRAVCLGDSQSWATSMPALHPHQQMFSRRLCPPGQLAHYMGRRRWRRRGGSQEARRELEELAAAQLSPRPRGARAGVKDRTLPARSAAAPAPAPQPQPQPQVRCVSVPCDRCKKTTRYVLWKPGYIGAVLY